MSAELLQRAKVESELKPAVLLLSQQLITSFHMTFQSRIYENIFNSLTLEFMELRASDAVPNRPELFRSRWRKRMDNFIPWNLRRTDMSAVLADLDNSLSSHSSTVSTKPADTLVVHPALLTLLSSRLSEASTTAGRHSCFVCTADDKELYQRDIEIVKGAEYYVKPPETCIRINGTNRYIMTSPRLTDKDNNKFNRAEAVAQFKSFITLGCIPSKYHDLLPPFAEIKAFNLTAVMVTDLDLGSDACLTMERVMMNGGYYTPSTYLPSNYNIMFKNKTSTLKLLDTSVASWNAFREMPYNTGNVLTLLMPSRKVYFRPQTKDFQPCICYGCSDVPPSPIEGDIVAGMTLLKHNNLKIDQNTEEFAYIRDSLARPLDQDDVDLALEFYTYQFADFQKNSTDGYRKKIFDSLKKREWMTPMFNYDQLIIVRNVLIQFRENCQDSNSSRLMSSALARIENIIALTQSILRLYFNLIKTRSDYTHSWLFLPLGRATIQRQFCGLPMNEESTPLYNQAVVYDRLILRLFSPKTFVFGAISIEEALDSQLVSKYTARLNLAASVKHDKFSFETLVCKTSFTTLEHSGEKGGILCVSDCLSYYDYEHTSMPFWNTRVFSPLNDFVNNNYSYRITRIVENGVESILKVVTLLFISFLQNPTTTHLLVSKGIYPNTAFFMYRNVAIKTCSVALCRSGAPHRYLFVGNGCTQGYKRDHVGLSIDVRTECVCVDSCPENDARVVHHVGGLGYEGGCGTQIYNPQRPGNVPDTAFNKGKKERKNGDIVVLPLPSATNAFYWKDIQPINGRVSRADGNNAIDVTARDQVTGEYTTNPFATKGLGEAQLLLGKCGHPLFKVDQEPEDGVYSSFVQSKNPPVQVKTGFDGFFQPMYQGLKASTNVACQCRQYHANTEHIPTAFRSIHKGFLGPNLHSGSSFKNLLNLSTFRQDEGMMLVDPQTCQPVAPLPNLVRTGARNMFPPKS